MHLILAGLNPLRMVGAMHLRGVDQVEKGATTDLERWLVRADSTEFTSRVGFAERDRRVRGDSGAIILVQPRADKA